MVLLIQEGGHSLKKRKNCKALLLMVCFLHSGISCKNIYLSQNKVLGCKSQFYVSGLDYVTDYGRSMKPFSSESQTFGLVQTIWADKIGAFGFFWPIYQHPCWYCESLVHVFHYSTLISTKKLSLYIHIPNIYLGL